MALLHALHILIFCRFSDISGSFDADKFHNAYSFLDEHQVDNFNVTCVEASNVLQEQEINSLAKQLKKVKNSETKEKLQKEFSRWVFVSQILRMYRRNAFS